MCGIFGVHNHVKAVPTILHGLKKLEYRGYDSSGVAILHDNRIITRRAQGKITNLERLIDEKPVSGFMGIGHTRWATHGVPSTHNAHPHSYKNVVVVHNGIIENYQQLKEQLISRGHTFISQTDSEVVPHMIQQYLDLGYSHTDAILATLEEIHGSYALGIMIKQAPNKIYAARHASPLAIGEGKDGLFLASDALALGEFTDKIYYPEEKHLVTLTDNGPSTKTLNGRKVSVSFSDLESKEFNVSKGEYEHFMLKEIHEQPDVLSEILSQPLQKMADIALIKRLHLVACGTSYYAASVAKYWFESIAQIPVNIDIASEFRYRDTPFIEGDAAMFISQSGETADTLAAMNHAKQCGIPVMSLVNVASSSMAREARYYWLTHAGPEIGVASTKALTAQLTQLYRLANQWALKRFVIDQNQYNVNLSMLNNVRSLIVKLLRQSEFIKAFTHIFSHHSSALFLARGSLFPLASEGALKLKEISYIHAEGFAFGELKHGPIALVDNDLPIVALIQKDSLAAKAKSNLQEVSARGGRVILIADRETVLELQDEVEASFIMPEVDSEVAPLVYLIPLQLLAYYTALEKGCDVDQPRNLAKSVTVE